MALSLSRLSPADHQAAGEQAIDTIISTPVPAAACSARAATAGTVTVIAG
jgi:hypothetical protein